MCRNQFAAPQPDCRGVDCLLAQRPKPLSLKRRVTVANLAVEKQRFQSVVHRTCQHHAAEDLEAFVRGQRRLKSQSAEKSVARLRQLVVRLSKTIWDVDAGGGLRKMVWDFRRRETARQFLAK